MYQKSCYRPHFPASTPKGHFCPNLAWKTERPVHNLAWEGVGLADLPQRAEKTSVLTSLRAPDDRPGEVLNCSLGSRWRQVVIPVYYQPQVFKVHPIEK